MDKRPIGIFDSGVGGLTVCQAVKELLPHENIIYFGDTMRFPYGTRSINTVVNYSREITEYFRSRDVKMIVCACNTASAAAVPTLRSENNIPVIGVIEAGSKRACEVLEKGPVGVIATRATVNSQAYTQEINKINPELEVLHQQASIFVSLVEEGWTEDEITHLTAKKYIEQLYNKDVRTLILGCTHFPLLKKAINHVYPDINLVDTSRAIAEEVQRILIEKNLENLKDEGKIELYASEITEIISHLKELFFGDSRIKLEQLIISGKK